jgi:hypothetical protein
LKGIKQRKAFLFIIFFSLKKLFSFPLTLIESPKSSSLCH